MGKLKLTESQVSMLQSMEETLPKKRIVRLTSEQYNRLFEGEGFEFKMPPKPTMASHKVKRHFKKAGKEMPSEDPIKFEGELLGHPIGGEGGKEYNPQSEKENQKTHKSFNESLNEAVAIDVIDFGHGVIKFLKTLLTDPSDESTPDFLEDIGVGRTDLMGEMLELGMIGRQIMNGRKIIRVMKNDFVGNIKKLYDKFVEIPDANEMVKPIQMGNDIELPENKVRKAFKAPFEKKGNKPSPEQIQKNLKAKRNAELARRKQVGEDNYPAGAAQDPNAPWNDDKNISKARQPQQELFNLVWAHQEQAIFERDGKYYLFNTESVDQSDFAEYADRDEEFYGHDEDGEPMVDYGDFEMDDSVISNFVNDNYKNLSFGKGYDAWENGAQFVEMDQTNIDELMGLAKFMVNKGHDPKQGEELLRLLSTMGMSETTSAAGSSGAFVGKMGMNAPITRVTSMSPENEMEELIDEKSKKKKRAKVQQMKDDESNVEKPTEKKDGLQTIQVTQQDLKDAMGRGTVHKDKKKDKEKYAGRKDKHKGDIIDEYDDSESDDLSDLKHKFFQHPELGGFAVSGVRDKKEDDDKLSVLISLEDNDGELLDSDLIYAYDKKTGEETLMFNNKFEKIHDPYKLFDELYANVFNEIREKLRPEGIDEVTTASSSGSYVTPKMWAKNKSEMRFAKDTMYPNGKIVDPTLKESTGSKKSKVNPAVNYRMAEGKTACGNCAHFNGSNGTCKIVAGKIEADYSCDLHKPKGINESAGDNLKDTAYPEGGFVEIDDCTKLNNNKEAQNGGCSVGAVDNVVKTKKTKDSVISDDALYYEVAQKTGRSLDEVKKIIQTKKG